LTIEELLYVWSGENNFGVSQNSEMENLNKEKSEINNFSNDVNRDSIINFKTIIINSVYFESDLKRLFLFKARTEDDIKEELKPKELTQQELMRFVEEKFREFDYKKISIMLDKREIILNFDFPQGVDSYIKNIMEDFYKETEWKVNINEKINNSSAELLIKKLIDPTKIKKISFYPEKFSVSVFLNGKNTNEGIESKVFEDKTGWKLCILEEGSSLANNSLDSDKLYFEVEGVKAVEQNVAISLIDKTFENEGHKPYKKSIKTNQKGKYIELVFISPKIGQKFEEKLGHLSYETGWSIAISDKVNQNELFNVAKLLCDKNEMGLKKNPSYNPGNMTVSLNVSNGEENFYRIKEEFEKITGCSLVIN